jgi:hypothetical protein
MAPLEKEREFRVRVKDIAEQNRKWKDHHELTLNRYQAMLLEVQAWEPGADELAPLKNFMLEQIQESIRFDCGGSPSSMVPPESAEEEHDRMTEELRWLAGRAREMREKTVKNLERKRSYLAALEKSLGPKP